MYFIDVSKAIGDTLGLNANGNYVVTGYEVEEKQINKKSVEQGGNLVEAYYLGGIFPDSGGSYGGSGEHHATFQVMVTAITGGQGDIDVLGDPNATPGQKAIAMAAFQKASEVLSNQLDLLISNVYNVIMAPQNRWFGLGEYTISSRKITNIKKTEMYEDEAGILGRGAFLDITCRFAEVVEGIPLPVPTELPETETDIEIKSKIDGAVKSEIEVDVPQVE